MSNERREFLKKLLTLTVFTGVCPHIALGEISPKEIIKEDEDRLQGIYYLDLNEYPELQNEYGSVLINVLNNKKPTFYESIFVTRVPESIKDDHFTVLNRVCPHEFNIVYPLHPFKKTFECSGHGTIFNVTGGYISGPAAQDLTSYQFYAWEPGDRYLKILFDFYDSSIVEEKTHLYLKNSYPNPSDEYININYGTDIDAYISYKITDLNGKVVLESKNIFKVAGDYNEKINIKKLANGAYILSVYLNGIKSNSIKILKTKN